MKIMARNGTKIVKINRRDWEIIGRKTGWIKEAFRNPLDTLTNKYTKEIFQRIIKGVDFEDYCFEEDAPLLKRFYVSSFCVTVVADKDLKNPFSVQGVTSYDETLNFKGKREKTQGIEINIRYNPNTFNKTSWDKLYKKLSFVIRHEFEHAFLGAESDITDHSGFFANPGINIFEHVEKVYKYLSLKSEREAFIKSFVFLAKKEKVDALKLIKEYILNLMFGPADNPLRERWIQIAFNNPQTLKNGKTIFDTWFSLVKMYKERLELFSSGAHPKDIKMIPGRKKLENI